MSPTLEAARIAERITRIDSVRSLLTAAMQALLNLDEELAAAELERAAERLEQVRA